MRGQLRKIFHGYSFALYKSRIMSHPHHYWWRLLHTTYLSWNAACMPTMKLHFGSAFTTCRALSSEKSIDNPVWCFVTLHLLISLIAYQVRSWMSMPESTLPNPPSPIRALKMKECLLMIELSSWLKSVIGSRQGTKVKLVRVYCQLYDAVVVVVAQFIFVCRSCFDQEESTAVESPQVNPLKTFLKNYARAYFNLGFA